MSKVVGTILTVAAVGLSIASGFGLAVAPWIVPALAGAAFVNQALLASSAKGPAMADRQASATTVRIGEQSREAWFGRCAGAGSLLDAFNYGGKYGTDWEVAVFALADHRCDALEGFWVNDAYVAFAGDGPVTGYNGQLQVYWRPGTENQILPAVLTAQGGWAATDNCAGVCFVVVAYKADAADAKNPVWPGGRPTFLWQMRGLRCYDPRKDSTVPGGSGSHRWADPATREWSENAEICRYNFDRGIFACDRVDQPGMLLVGRGLSATEAPPERIFAAANLCDEAVALAAGGTEPRYRVGGAVASSEEFGNVTDDFAAAMGGVVTQPEGGVAVEPGHAKAPVAFLTDADFISGTRIAASDFRSEADQEWVNTVIPRYVEPKQKWKDHGAPIRRNTADVIADGGTREAPLSLRLVTSGTQAQRIAEIRRRMGRLLRTRSGTLGPRFANLEAGDWIVWTSARHSHGLPVVYRIESHAIPENWHNTITLRAITSSVFTWTTADQIADGATAEATNPPSEHGMPDIGDWSLSATTIGSPENRIPALTFTGLVSDAYVLGVSFGYRRTGDVAWTDEPIGPPIAPTRVIAPVDPETAYEGSVTYFYSDGRSDRRVLGPVTTDPMFAGMEELIAAATAIAEGKVATFFQTTPPSAAESKENDLWFDTDDGNFMYRRLPGDGRISIGGTVVTFPGYGAIVYPPWAPAPDQRIAQALAQAASAISAAQQAQATADQAIDSLTALGDDGLLTGVEKKQLILDDSRLQGAWSILDAQAATFGITTERTAAANARTAWLALRNAYSPAWNDTNADTTIVRATFIATLSAYDAALETLQKAISAKAATIADWDGVTGAGKTQLIADANTAKANAQTALNEIAVIQSDGYLSRDEKPDVIRRRGDIEAEYGGIVAKASSQGVSTSTYTAAYSALIAYLDALSPAWNNTSLDTAIVPATFNGKFGDYYFARTDLLNDAADLTLANVPSFTIATSLEIPADYLGAISGGTLPKYITPDVKVGGADARTSNLSSYVLGNWTGGCTNINTTVDNGAGSATKGRVALLAGWNATGTVDITFTYNGVALKTERLTFTKKNANPPSGGGGGGSNKSGSFDATGLGVGDTTLAEIGRVSNLTKAAGETIRTIFTASYTLSATGNSLRHMIVKAQYSPAGANSWTDVAAAVAGSNAQYLVGSGESTTGAVNWDQSAAPADGAYDVRLVAAINSTANSASLLIETGNFFVDIGA